MEKFDGSGKAPEMRGGNGKDAAALSIFSKLTGGGLLGCWILLLLLLLLLELTRFCRFISSESFKYYKKKLVDNSQSSNQENIRVQIQNEYLH